MPNSSPDRRHLMACFTGTCLQLCGLGLCPSVTKIITRRAPATRPATPRSCGRSACRRRAQSTSSTRRTVVAPPPNSALPHACPRPPNRYVARRRARYAAGGGGGGFGGLGGAGFGGRGGSMGQPILGGFDLAGRG